MRDLFLSECRRHLRPALLLFAIHLLLLAIGLNNLPGLHLGLQLLALTAYTLVGVSFAVYQLGSYRKPSRWLWLMHRPLPRGAIFGALALASATMIALAIGLPLLLNLLGNEWFTERPVDLRHYLAAPFVMMITFMAWLGGAAIMLSASRFAVLIMALPCMMLLHHASAPALLAASVPCAALMAAMVYNSFKANRSAPPASSSATVATALPLVLGMYFVLFLGSYGLFQGVIQGLNQDPRSMITRPADSYSNVRWATSPALMLGALDNADDDRTPRWRSEMATHTPYDLTLARIQFAVPQQLSNKSTPIAVEPEYQRGTYFNHDRMRLELLDQNTGALVASLGPGGANDPQGFPAVLLLAQKLLLPQAVMDFDPKNLTFITLATLPAGESLAARPMQKGSTMYLLSDKRLIAYRIMGPETPYQQQYSIALPQAASALSRIDVASLSDGTLIAFTGGVGGTQQTVFIDATGQSQIVASRTLGHDYPVLIEQMNWWLSPVLDAVRALPAQILPGGVPEANQPTLAQRPAPVWAAAVLSSLLAVGGALLWRRRARHGQWIGKGWLLACLLLGLPCLATLAVMYPRAARPVQGQQRDADTSRLPA